MNSTPPRLLVVTGLPGSGKTTLARELARRYGVALIGKDAIKEPLMDALESGDAAHSRRLSDMSFAVLFSLAQEFVAAGADLILEGNFRRGEHESTLRELAPVRLAQLLCTIDENRRQVRLRERATDPSRHQGHREGERSDDRVAADCLLELPGERIIADESAGDAIDRIDRWWNAQ